MKLLPASCMCAHRTGVLRAMGTRSCAGGGTVPALQKLEGPVGVSGLQVRLGLVTHPPVEPWSLLNLYFLLCPV